METVTNNVEEKGRRLSRKRFWGALVAGLLFLSMIVGFFGLTGKAYALPMAGIGDFNVSFNKRISIKVIVRKPSFLNDPPLYNKTAFYCRSWTNSIELDNNMDRGTSLNFEGKGPI